MRPFVLVILTALVLAGCASTRKHDLDSLMGKASTGMTELQVTQAMGAPSKIDVDGTTRRLIYDGEGGGNVTVTLVSDRVVEARRN